MVETTPLGKWSGRRRMDLRLVLSSPQEKMKTKASVSLRKGGAMVEVKVEKCAGIDGGKKFLAVCVLIGLGNQKPVGEVRRFGTSVKELERLRAWLLCIHSKFSSLTVKRSQVQFCRTTSKAWTGLPPGSLFVPATNGHHE